MALDFGLEGSGPDAKDPPSVCSVRARKIRGSENPVVWLEQFTMDVASGENFLAPSETNHN